MITGQAAQGKLPNGPCRALDALHLVLVSWTPQDAPALVIKEMNVKIIQRVTKYLERLMTAPGQELSNWAKFVRFQIRLWRFCARRLWENNVMAMSAALSFRTIFALIPILVLGFLLMKSFGALEASEQRLHEFLVSSGLEQIAIGQEVAEMPEKEGASLSTSPAETKVINVVDEIEKLVTRIESKLTVGRLGPVGAALLI